MAVSVMKWCSAQGASFFLAALAVAIVIRQPTHSQAAETRLFRDLVAQIGGRSDRGTDVPSITPADVAEERLEAIGRPAVPYLIEALKSPKGWAKVHAMEILASMREQEAVQPILRILRADPEEGVREQAAYNLGVFGDRSAVPDLLKLATQGSLNACHSLGQLRAAQAVPILIRHIADRQRSIPAGYLTNDVCRDALTEIGPKAVPALIRCYRSGGDEARQKAAVALGEIGTKQAVEVLKKGLRDPAKRDAAISGLLAGTSPDAVPLAARAVRGLTHASEAFRFFERRGDPGCMPAVRPVLEGKGDDKENVGDALRLVQKFKDRESIPFLVKWIEHSSDWRGPAAGYAIARLGPDGLGALEKQMKANPGANAQIGPALAGFDDAAAAPEMTRILAVANSDPIVIGAITALGQMRYSKAADLVARHLKGSSPGVRMAAVLSLGQMGDPRALPGLTAMTAHQAQACGAEHWKALGAKALPALKPLFFAHNPTAVEAVASIGNPEATQWLIEGVRNSDAGFAATCAKALGKRHASEAAGPLRAALDRQEMDVRFEAYISLRNLGQVPAD